jgi:hypothetical protein
MRRAVLCLALAAGCHGQMGTPDTGNKQWIGQFRLSGVTSDGFAIVADSQQGGISVEAIALDNTSQQLILDNATGAGVVGRVVFATRPSQGGDVTTVWSSTVSAHDLDILAILAPTASADGEFIAFADDKSIYLARTDGTREQKITDYSTQMGMCPVQFAFVGARLVFLRCATDVVMSTLSSIELSSFTPIDIASRSTSFVGNHAGTHVAVLTGTKGATIYPVIGGDGVALMGDFASARFLPDDTALLFTTADGTLQRAPVSGAAPTMLQTMSALAIVGEVSPNGKSLLFDSQISMLGSDLFLGSSQHAGAPVTLSTDPSAGLYGEGFTDDSVLALYSSKITGAGPMGPFLGDFEAQAVGGGAPIHLADQVWQWNTVGGSRLVYDDNLMDISTNVYTGTADLEFIDLSLGQTPMKIAKSIDLIYYLSPDHKAVVYTATGSLYYQLLP